MCRLIPRPWRRVMQESGDNPPQPLPAKPPPPHSTLSDLDLQQVPGVGDTTSPPCWPLPTSCPLLCSYPEP